MTEVVFIVVSTLLVGIGAAICHELTHWAVARLGGRPAWVDWRELNCYHHLPIAGPGVVDYAVGIAPFVVGSVAGAVWWAAGLDINIPILVGWAVYTLNGIPNDFRIDPGEPPVRAADL